MKGYDNACVEQNHIQEWVDSGGCVGSGVEDVYRKLCFCESTLHCGGNCVLNAVFGEFVNLGFEHEKDAVWAGAPGDVPVKGVWRNR